MAVEAVQCVTILTLMAAREAGGEGVGEKGGTFVKLFREEGLI